MSLLLVLLQGRVGLMWGLDFVVKAGNVALPGGRVDDTGESVLYTYFMSYIFNYTNTDYYVGKDINLEATARREGLLPPSSLPSESY